VVLYPPDEAEGLELFQAPGKSGPETVAGYSDAEKTLYDFVLEHHDRVSRQDLDGLAEDYAASVRYFDYGTVDRAFIRKDQAGYFEKWPSVFEEVVGLNGVTPAGSDGRYVVRYQVVFILKSAFVGHRRERRSGEVAVELEVQWDGESRPRITAQSGVVSNVRTDEEYEGE
jgi:hypothetical protein